MHLVAFRKGEPGLKEAFDHGNLHEQVTTEETAETLNVSIPKERPSLIFNR